MILGSLPMSRRGVAFVRVGLWGTLSVAAALAGCSHPAKVVPAAANGGPHTGSAFDHMTPAQMEALVNNPSTPPGIKKMLQKKLAAMDGQTHL